MLLKGIDMYIGIDLGSTNLKVVLYDNNMRAVARKASPVVYQRENGFVEFDAKTYVNGLLDLLCELAEEQDLSELDGISFTGQAESLVCLDKSGEAVYPIISWMDERSSEECHILEEGFSDEICRKMTGQQAVLPTWPATKILWLKRHEPEIFESVATYMLLKDYLVYCLTGRMCADMSIATFSFYFDIYGKRYWKDMLDAIGITEEQLPPLVEPCTVAGTLKDGIGKKLGVKKAVSVNVGTLDHFAGMVGSGNVAPGNVTLSTGTTMVLAVMTEDRPIAGCDTAVHYGFLPDTYVLLPVIESGGMCLEWFRHHCMNDLDYRLLDKEILSVNQEKAPLFLPYISGTNSPEFDKEATGVFYGLRAEHTAYDMAWAVVEGVCFTLKKNCEYLAERGAAVSRILAIGGGAKSAVWCQAQTDATGLPVVVPCETEAACLGAVILAAVSDGVYPDLPSACEAIVTVAKEYRPDPSSRLSKRYGKFQTIYHAMLAIEKDGTASHREISQ